MSVNNLSEFVLFSSIYDFVPVIFFYCIIPSYIWK